MFLLLFTERLPHPSCHAWSFVGFRVQRIRVLCLFTVFSVGRGRSNDEPRFFAHYRETAASSHNGSAGNTDCSCVNIYTVLLILVATILGVKKNETL